ncbi:hypothetical protein [Lonepinella sp. MS14436]|uniref:hypothetical protein n=1 Tax=Lonepinella sp. MS14436 TaxID=3003619 RepID=UPI0036DF3C37
MFDLEDGWSGLSLFYIINKDKVPGHFSKNSKMELELMCEELHKEMQKGKDTDWRKLIILIEFDRDMKVNFIYEKQSLAL